MYLCDVRFLTSNLVQPCTCFSYFLLQGSWTRCSADGRWTAEFAGGVNSASDVAHCPADSSRHGVSGLTAFRAQRPGHTQLPGGREPACQDRRLRHVQRCVQHRLLQSKCGSPWKCPYHSGPFGPRNPKTTTSVFFRLNPECITALYRILFKSQKSNIYIIQNIDDKLL